MRQTIKEIEVNMAYRWFIGYDIGEKIPHFSTFGKNYTRRFQGTDIFERIFNHILNEAVNCGFVDASAVFIDGTHIKANANKKKSQPAEIEIQARSYQKQLDEEIAKDRESHGKKPLKNDDSNDDDQPPTPPATKTVAQSKTDPECGMFHKGEHEKQFAYVANTACDKHNFILDFVSDEYFDCMLCPNNQVLTYSTTNREGYREYKSNAEICKNCSMRSQCTESKACQKVVTRHIWEPYMELAEDYRHTPEYRDIYKLRSETIERVFADAKEKHGIRYTQLRGLQRVKMQVTLTFACMNLKKLATWKRRKGMLPPPLHHFIKQLTDYYYLFLNQRGCCKTPLTKKGRSNHTKRYWLLRLFALKYSCETNNKALRA